MNNLSLLTPATIKELYGNDYVSVKNFSLTHIVELSIAIIASIVIFKLYKKANEKSKTKILVCLNVLIWLDEIFKYIFTISTNQWIWNYLPLHLCSINIFVCTIHTITRSDKVKDLLYALCLPGAIVALIISPWFTAPVLNCMHIHSYTIHVMLVIYSLLCLADGYRPNIKRIPFNALILVLISIPMFFINKLLDTNFLYISKPEEIIVTKYLYNIFGDLYPLSFIFLIMIVWLLLYLPWIKKKNV